MFTGVIEKKNGELEFLDPVVSKVIFDKKAKPELTIYELSEFYAPASSQKKLIVLCNSVAKENIEVRIFEKQNDKIIWEALGEMTPRSVHKQSAIVFKMPKYRLETVNEPVLCFIQLRRKNDGEVSLPKIFFFIPDSVCTPKDYISELEDMLIKYENSSIKNLDSIMNSTTNFSSNNGFSNNLTINNLDLTNLPTNLSIQNFSFQNFSSNSDFNTSSSSFNQFKKKIKLEDQSLDKKNYFVNENLNILPSNCLNPLLINTDKQIDDQQKLLNNFHCNLNTSNSKQQTQISNSNLDNSLLLSPIINLRRNSINSSFTSSSNNSLSTNLSLNNLNNSSQNLNDLQIEPKFNQTQLKGDLNQNFLQINNESADFNLNKLVNNTLSNLNSSPLSKD